MKNDFKYREDFPLIKNNDFAYLDSAATSQKPKCVADVLNEYYLKKNANVHRGTYSLSVEASNLVDNARNMIKELVNAKYKEEIVFTKNATESLNLIAYSYGLNNLNSGDEIVLSIMEHHSMIVPFQMVAKKTGASLKYMYLNDDYQIADDEIQNKITTKTKIVGISSVSNVLGTISSYEKIIKKAHSVGAVVILDISQSIAHMPCDVQRLNVDFVVFSAHKMYGPLGVGVLYAKKEILEKMSPFLMGGDMIEYVEEQDATFAPLPNKFEAGTIDAGSILGFAKAIEYLKNIGYEKIQNHESEITKYALKELSKLNFVETYCTKDLNQHSAVISFNVKGVHAHDVSSILDANGVFVRAGNHCAQPLLTWLKISSTLRASFSIYSTKEDVDKLVSGLLKVYEMFKKYI